MSRSKSPIALAMAFALMGATPAFAWRMGGPEWLQMMGKIRADRADSGSPRTERARLEHGGSFTAHVPGSSRNRTIPRTR